MLRLASFCPCGRAAPADCSRPPQANFIRRWLLLLLLLLPPMPLPLLLLLLLLLLFVLARSRRRAFPGVSLKMSQKLPSAPEGGVRTFAAPVTGH